MTTLEKFQSSRVAEPLKSPREKAWEECATALHAAVLRFNQECSALHHNKGEFHNPSEPCPVVAKINAAIERFNIFKRKP